MANLDHLEVMARLTCQALRVFGWWFRLVGSP